jgi:DedD protein
MAEQSAASDERALKQRAMRRLALALALIVAAIVGLGLLDHYSGRKRTATPQAPSTEPPPIATLPQPQVEPTKPAVEAPVAQPAPALPPPPPPSVEEQANAPASAGTSPGSAPAAGAGQSSSGAGPSRSNHAAPPAGKPGVPAQTTAAPSASGPVPTLQAREGFVVQLGVFTTVENAQALEAKLKEQGIPVFLETRVVVGPFRDRAEAEAAHRKLKALGVGGVIVERK